MFADCIVHDQQTCPNEKPLKLTKPTIPTMVSGQCGRFERFCRFSVVVGFVVDDCHLIASHHVEDLAAHDGIHLPTGVGLAATAVGEL